MNQEEAKNVVSNKIEEGNSSDQGANNTLGIAAIFISVLSMVAVIYQSYLAKEENELIRIQQSATTMPYLSHWYSDIDGKYKFVVANKGVGPAFIKEVEFMANESEKISVFNSSSDLIYFMEQNSEVIDTTPWVKYHLQPNMLVSKDETIEVYTFFIENDRQEKQLKSEFNKLFEGFKIVYEDIYGNSWVLDSKVNYPIEFKKE